MFPLVKREEIVGVSFRDLGTTFVLNYSALTWNIELISGIHWNMSLSYSLWVTQLKIFSNFLSSGFFCINSLGDKLPDLVIQKITVFIWFLFFLRDKKNILAIINLVLRKEVDIVSVKNLSHSPGKELLWIKMGHAPADDESRRGQWGGMKQEHWVILHGPQAWKWEESLTTKNLHQVEPWSSHFHDHSLSEYWGFF